VGRRTYAAVEYSRVRAPRVLASVRSGRVAPPRLSERPRASGVSVAKAEDALGNEHGQHACAPAGARARRGSVARVDGRVATGQPRPA